MTMTAEHAALTLEEANARIRQLKADAARREQERRFGGWQIGAAVLAAFATAAAAAGGLIIAGVALAKYLQHIS